MRIAHLCTNDFGGAAIAAINLHEALLKQGMESDLLTLGRTRSDITRHHAIEPFELHPPVSLAKARYKARRFLERTGLVEDRSVGPDNRNLRNGPTGREIFSLPYSFFDVDRHSIIQQADVVHLHWVSRGLIGFDRFFERCDKPIVWTMHDMNPFTGGCHHADECEGFTLACNDCPQLADHERAHSYWRKKQAALSQLSQDRLRLAAPSAWLAERSQRSSIMAGRTCAVIPNGFDCSRFHPMQQTQARARLNLPLDKRVVLFSAFDAANPRKGMHLLRHALKGRNDLVLVSMGHAMPELKGRPNAISTGLLVEPELIALHYAAADLFVLPSQAENLPNTISEALLCGTPVCAFRVGGIPEQIDDRNGILAAPGDADALRAAIAQALEREWDREAIARRAALLYDRDHIAGSYRELYRELLA